MKDGSTLVKVIDKVDFFAFGETEHGTHTKALKLILKEISKFERMFLEIPINLQQSVDFFLKSNEIDDDLSDFLKGVQQKGKRVDETVFSVLEVCKKGNKQVFCIDPSKIKTHLYNKKSTNGFYFLAIGSREGDMFNNIKDVLKDSNGKSVLLGGSTHIKYGVNMADNQKTLGTRLQDSWVRIFIMFVYEKLNGVRSCHFYDTHDNSEDGRLNKLLKKEGFSNLDENSKRYFDGYIIHD